MKEQIFLEKKSKVIQKSVLEHKPWKLHMSEEIMKSRKAYQ